MTAKRWTGTAFIDLTTLKRWSGSAWVDITIAKRWDGSAWVDILGAGGSPTGLQVTIDGFAVSTVICVANIDPFCPFVSQVTTASITAVASGGTGAGPTYSWQFISGDSSITATNPTSATTAFTTSVNRNATKNAVFKCVVTQGAETREVLHDVILSYDYFTGNFEP